MAGGGGGGRGYLYWLDSPRLGPLIVVLAMFCFTVIMVFRYVDVDRENIVDTRQHLILSESNPSD